MVLDQLVIDNNFKKKIIEQIKFSIDMHNEFPQNEMIEERIARDLEKTFSDYLKYIYEDMEDYIKDEICFRCPYGV